MTLSSVKCKHIMVKPVTQKIKMVKEGEKKGTTFVEYKEIAHVQCMGTCRRILSEKQYVNSIVVSTHVIDTRK